MGDWTQEEVRVLGVLIEKAITTPDQYPLSLNALINGCNQTTSREPVLDLGEQEVMEALTLLRDRHVVYRVDQAGARVPKFMHRLTESWNLEGAPLVLLAVLMLRGPQTVGQLRQRSERMYGFRDLEQVRECLEGMMQRVASPETLVVTLPVSAGNKEVRYAHTLHEPAWTQSEDGGRAESGNDQHRIDSLPGLRERVGQLEAELIRLRAEFEAFRDQF